MEELLQAPVTATLIVLNILASTAAWQNQDVMNRGLYHIGPMQSGQWDRGITSGFLHANLMHLFFNMYVLYGFGIPLERILGSAGFAFVYAAALIGGSAWSYMENFRNPNYRAYGASGAVSGVLISICLFVPLAQLSFFGIIPMPAVVFVVMFIAISALLSTRENTIIGHDAHLGGALVGLGATLILRPDAWPRFIKTVSEALGLG